MYGVTFRGTLGTGASNLNVRRVAFYPMKGLRATRIGARPPRGISAARCLSQGV
jgi:hypothetical protein